MSPFFWVVLNVLRDTMIGFFATDNDFKIIALPFSVVKFLPTQLFNAAENYQGNRIAKTLSRTS